MKGNIDNFKQIIAKELGLGEREVGNTLALLNDGCTIPFISRYRKERTGSMDEMQIAAIGIRLNLKIFTFHSNPNDAQGRKWHERMASSHLPK